MTLPKLIWHPSPNFSSRHGLAVTRLILHDCQGSYLGSVATFLGDNGGNPVSAHFVVKDDGSEVTQMVDLADKAWHAVNANPYSVGLEMAGYAERGFADSELATAALIFAYLCKHMNIPIRHAAGVSEPGISSHFDLGKFGGGHSDPSVHPQFMDDFVARVAAIAPTDIPSDWPGMHDRLAPSPPTAPSVPSQPLPDLSTTKGIQQALVSLGARIDVDGAYGPQTRIAVADFQRQSGIIVDGTVGPDTRAALAKELAAL